jgi:hypothetical protein
VTEGVTVNDIRVIHGDSIEAMRAMPEASIDAIVTDPPYGLGFMGKAWDDLPPGEEWARECLRVLKPGGHLLAFGGTRTWHRLAVAVEDAGFEIRDSIAWLYGSGFPKSHDVGKALVKAGADEAERWQGWGTALKPAFEPIVVGRKPLAGTVAANVLAHGTGALNIDACRVGAQGESLTRGNSINAYMLGGCSTVEELRELAARDAPCPDPRKGSARAVLAYLEKWQASGGYAQHESGRWPANVVLDDTQAAELDDQGGASRFFPTFKYQAKAPKRERPKVDGVAHPTVKPLELMRWLVRLVTPPGGVVLDPFAGSGTTLEAAKLEGFAAVGIEREAEYLPLIDARLTRTESA